MKCEGSEKTEQWPYSDYCRSFKFKAFLLFKFRVLERKRRRKRTEEMRNEGGRPKETRSIHIHKQYFVLGGASQWDHVLVAAYSRNDFVLQ